MSDPTLHCGRSHDVDTDGDDDPDHDPDADPGTIHPGDVVVEWGDRFWCAPDCIAIYLLEHADDITATPLDDLDLDRLEGEIDTYVFDPVADADGETVDAERDHSVLSADPTDADDPSNDRLRAQFNGDALPPDADDASPPDPR